jgi:large subunit ribosomal protein L22
MPVVTTARLRYVSIPPRKMRLVANLVKGLPIQKALDILNFTKRAAAMPIAKTLKSAAANALSIEGSSHVKPEDLIVKNIMVDAAPSAKRIRYQSMGRVFRYRKRFCHLTVTLEEKASAVTPVPSPGKEKTKGAGGTAETEKRTKSVKKASSSKTNKSAAKSSKKTTGKAAKKKTAANPKKKTAAKSKRTK